MAKEKIIIKNIEEASKVKTALEEGTSVEVVLAVLDTYDRTTLLEHLNPLEVLLQSENYTSEKFVEAARALETSFPELLKIVLVKGSAEQINEIFTSFERVDILAAVNPLEILLKAQPFDRDKFTKVARGFGEKLTDTLLQAYKADSVASRNAGDLYFGRDESMPVIYGADGIGVAGIFRNAMLTNSTTQLHSKVTAVLSVVAKDKKATYSEIAFKCTLQHDSEIDFQHQELAQSLALQYGLYEKRYQPGINELEKEEKRLLAQATLVKYSFNRNNQATLEGRIEQTSEEIERLEAILNNEKDMMEGQIAANKDKVARTHKANETLIIMALNLPHFEPAKLQDLAEKAVDHAMKQNNPKLLIEVLKAKNVDSLALMEAKKEQIQNWAQPKINMKEKPVQLYELVMNITEKALTTSKGAGTVQGKIMGESNKNPEYVKFKISSASIYAAHKNEVNLFNSSWAIKAIANQNGELYDYVIDAYRAAMKDLDKQIKIVDKEDIPFNAKRIINELLKEALVTTDEAERNELFKKAVDRTSYEVKEVAKKNVARFYGAEAAQGK